MSISLIFELQDELNRLLIAGTNLARDDYRLKRILQGLQKSAQTAPIFTRFVDILDICINQDNVGLKIIELSSMTYSLIYTQTSTSIEGEIKLLENNDINLETKTGYQRLNPVITALTSNNSGRYEIIKKAYEEGILNDLRMLNHLVHALNDTYIEIPKLITKILIEMGQVCIPILLSNFEINDERKNSFMIEIIVKLLKENGKEIYDQILISDYQKLKVTLIENLGIVDGYLNVLVDLTKDKKKAIKDAALIALGDIQSDIALEALYINFITDNYYSSYLSFLKNNPKVFTEKLISYGSDLLQLVKNQCEEIREKKASKKIYIEKLRDLLSIFITHKYSSNGLNNLLSKCLTIFNDYKDLLEEVINKVCILLFFNNDIKSVDLINSKFKDNLCPYDDVFKVTFMLNYRILDVKRFYKTYRIYLKRDDKNRLNYLLSQILISYINYLNNEIDSKLSEMEKDFYKDFILNEMWLSDFIELSLYKFITLFKKHKEAIKFMNKCKEKVGKGTLAIREYLELLVFFKEMDDTDYYSVIFDKMVDNFKIMSQNKYEDLNIINNLPESIKNEFAKKINEAEFNNENIRKYILNQIE